METPVEIDFQGEIPFHGLREKIVENLRNWKIASAASSAAVSS